MPEIFESLTIGQSWQVDVRIILFLLLWGLATGYVVWAVIMAVVMPATFGCRGTGRCPWKFMNNDQIDLISGLDELGQIIDFRDKALRGEGGISFIPYTYAYYSGVTLVALIVGWGYYAKRM